MQLFQKIDTAIRQASSQGVEPVTDLLIAKDVVEPLKDATWQSPKKRKSWLYRLLSEVERGMQKAFLNAFAGAVLRGASPDANSPSLYLDVLFSVLWTDVAEKVFSQLRGDPRIRVQKESFETFFQSDAVRNVVKDQLSSGIDPMRLISEKGDFEGLISSAESYLQKYNRYFYLEAANIAIHDYTLEHTPEGMDAHLMVRIDRNSR